MHENVIQYHISIASHCFGSLFNQERVIYKLNHRVQQETSKGTVYQMNHPQISKQPTEGSDVARTSKTCWLKKKKTKKINSVFN